MQKYNIIIKSLPELFFNIKELYDIKNEMPEILNENINKIILSGSFPYSLWSCKNSTFEIYSYEQIENTLKFIKDNNLAIFYEFNNTKLQEKHYEDNYMNMILELSKDIDVYASMYDENLAKYIQNNYSYVKLVKSGMNATIENTSPFKFHITNNKNNNSDIEKKIYNFTEEENIDNINKMSTDVLNYEFPTENNEINTKQPSLEEIEQVVEIGFNNIIVGISNNQYERIELLINYLVKEEYKDSVRLKLLNKMAGRLIANPQAK